ncbi:MAG TPA: hypothetical protein PLI74_08000, partial [Candidatus Kapabacteria bacterium]|nr:hypothetical protein [Candidatus Kapabacteria bacterium]
TRYFCLFDDAMISMQYAQNLAQGHGLTWNAGERIEGITNPLWAFGMALIHLCGIPQNYTSLCIQILGFVFLSLQCIIIWNISERLFPRTGIIPIVATLCTAMYLPLITWSLTGMEVSVCALLITYVLSKIDFYTHTTSIPWKEILLLALGTCIRIDMIVPGFVLLFALAFRSTSFHKKTFITGIVSFVGIIAIQTFLRFDYYGDFLPNTYYLKMTGISPVYRISRGLFSTVKFLFFFNPFLIILPFVYLRSHRHTTLYTIAALFIAQLCYSTYVGGDAWDWWGGANRYIALAIAPFFIVLSAALYHFFSIAENTYSFVKAQRNILIPLAVIILLVQINFQRDGSSLTTWLLIHPPFGTDDNKRNVEIALLLRHTSPQATIATITAGSIHYFTQRTMFDMLGKNDKYIARLSAIVPKDKNKFISFHPGHNKYDYHYSIAEKKPDIIVGIEEGNLQTQSLLTQYQRDKYKHHILYSKNDSKYIADYRKQIFISQTK